jgi:hypothetical protein
MIGISLAGFQHVHKRVSKRQAHLVESPERVGNRIVPPTDKALLDQLNKLRFDRTVL